MKDTQFSTLKFRNVEEKTAYLLHHSNLPGPRANLELLFEVMRLGDKELFLHCLTFEKDKAPTNTPGEFVYACGAAGLGQLISNGQHEYYQQLRKISNDSRWRVREGVAFALQYIGKQSFDSLIESVSEWIHGSHYEQRAVVAGLCEPALLVENSNAIKVLEILEEITQSILRIKDRKDDGFRSLRKGLGYGWSVAVAAHPVLGIEIFKSIQNIEDKDIIWIVKQNLKKKRLVKIFQEN